LRPRGSIYDNTGSIRDLLAQQMKGGRTNKKLHKVFRQHKPHKPRTTKWTLRLRVQIHSARNLIHAPGVQLLEEAHGGFATVRRGSMSMSLFDANTHVARPTVVVQCSNFTNFVETEKTAEAENRANILHMDLPAYRTSVATGLSNPSWEESSMDSVYMTPTLMDSDDTQNPNQQQPSSNHHSALSPTWLEDDDSDDSDDDENVHRRACYECLRHAKVTLLMKDAGLDSALLQGLKKNVKNDKGEDRTGVSGGGGGGGGGGGVAVVLCLQWWFFVFATVFVVVFVLFFSNTEFVFAEKEKPPPPRVRFRFRRRRRNQPWSSKCHFGPFPQRR